jgi:hypothetical protein
MKNLLTPLLTFALLAAAPSATYNGAPDVTLADSFIGSGGGAGSFSSVRAFDGMIGDPAVLDAQRDLNAAGGPGANDRFIHEFDYAIADAWTVASRQNVKLGSAPATTGSEDIARALVHDGTTPDGTFQTGYLFAHLFSPNVETQVMHDLDARFGAGASDQFKTLGNRFFSDVAADVKA